MYDGDLKHQAHENFDNPTISELTHFVNECSDSCTEKTKCGDDSDDEDIDNEF